MSSSKVRSSTSNNTTTMMTATSSVSASIDPSGASATTPLTIYNIKKQNPEPAFYLNPKGNVWRTYGSEKEMAAEAPPKSDRTAPTTMHFTMRRDFFLKRRQLHNFLNRDAADDSTPGVRYSREQMKEEFWVTKMESEASVQAVRTKADHATQSPNYRKVDFSVQVQPEIVDACAPPAAKPAFADAAGNNNAEDAEADAEETKERNKRARSFLEGVMPRMLHHLTQSAAVPLFQDDYQLLMDEDSSAVVSNREESDLIEAGNFSHHYTRDRYVSSIDWKPGPRMILAVASIKATSMESRFSASLDVEPSVSIIWNLHEQTNPQMLLESPTEALCIRFHPKPLSQIVIAGLANGQVVMWDLARAPADPRSRGAGVGVDGKSATTTGTTGVDGKTTTTVDGKTVTSATSAVSASATATTAAMGRAHLTMEEEVGPIPHLPEPIQGHTLEKASDEHVVSRLQPSMTSRVENSHRRAVHDIRWLPDNLECGFDGRATTQEVVYQFATISEDGYVFIWDLRPENLPSDRLRKLKHQGRSTGDENAKSWVPLLRYQLPRNEGLGDLVGLRLHLEGRTQGGQGPPSYLFMATTVEGEICCGQWGPKPGHEQDAPKSATGYDAGGSSAPAANQNTKIVRYVSPAHAGPVWGLHRHPLLPDIFLTVGDWGFKVWRVGVEVPILASPSGDQQTTCGCWSPSRPGIVFIGTLDGFVQVWDLLDRSHQPILVHAVIKDAITCIEFRPLMTAGVNLSAAAQKRLNAHQTIALGTKTGGFHFYELPRSLIRGPSAELKLAKQLFDKETRRVHYYSWRWDERRKELELRAAAVNVGGEGEGGAEGEGKPSAEDASAQGQKSKKHHHGSSRHHGRDDDMTGGQNDENAGDFVFTAEDDNQYLQLVEDLAKADTRMQHFLSAGKGKGNKEGEEEEENDDENDKNKKK